jgi:kynurenine formamidase
MRPPTRTTHSTLSTGHRRRFATPAVVLLASFVLTSCAPAGDAPRPAAELDVLGVAEMFDSGDVELVDLTHPLSPDGLYWPTGSPFIHERLDWGLNEAGQWYAAARFSSPEHLGTHLDAPIHFAEGGWTSAEIPIERLFAPAVVIDISDKAASDPDATLDPADIAAFEGRHGEIAGRSIVVVRSGWAGRWPDWNAYYGSETPTDVATLHFPGVSAAAAEVLASRGIAGIGIDTASIDRGPSTAFEAHRVLAAANIFNLENLTNVDGLPEAGFAIVALPMKIEGGTGGPTRVVAVVPR